MSSLILVLAWVILTGSTWLLVREWRKIDAEWTVIAEEWRRVSDTARDASAALRYARALHEEAKQE